MSKIFSRTINSPIGKMRISCTDKGISELHILGSKEKSTKASDSHPLLKKAEKQLNDFFAKKRESFDLPLDLTGTEFQKEAWKALCKIPYGETRSYGEQAKSMGRTSHFSRAVGGANNKNPIAIIIPCHRVVGSTGALVGYAGGLHIKEALLELERS
ncbi:MAG: methylated-DNA--[protein]-cysteine S-methyltransferase [Bdellovibrionaceae bacterium]|nr:methylated-DNA--[protein]-cysteine S-methyltransferase [Pseudobdellovibrionaceae bacterium]